MRHLSPAAVWSPAFPRLALSKANQLGHAQREPWSEVVLRDLRTTDGIRIEFIETESEAQQLVDKGECAGVLVFGPAFSDRVGRCSFLVGDSAINPFFRDGVDLKVLDVHFLHREPKMPPPASSSRSPRAA